MKKSAKSIKNSSVLIGETTSSFKETVETFGELALDSMDSFVANYYNSIHQHKKYSI